MRNIIKQLLHEGLKPFINEGDKNELKFLGYHSSNYDLSGFQQSEVLDPETYGDIIRTAYLEIISDYDEILENDDTEAMVASFEDRGLGFTYVSQEPIKGTAYQYQKYKYGDYLFKVYGNGGEYIIDDYNELSAEIIITNKALYFELIDVTEND